ncbi:hypothetical protein FA13DRAFT_1723885, partial [Coprinellus micaceus]
NSFPWYSLFLAPEKDWMCAFSKNPHCPPCLPFFGFARTGATWYSRRRERGRPSFLSSSIWECGVGVSRIALKRRPPCMDRTSLTSIWVGTTWSQSLADSSTSHFRISAGSSAWFCMMGVASSTIAIRSRRRCWKSLFLWCQTPSGRKQPFVKFDAPMLKRVFLHVPEACESITPNSISLPWKQITHLSFGARIGGVDRWVPSRNFFDFLSRTPCLTYLHITGVVLPKREATHIGLGLTLPHLKSMELFDHSLTFLLKSPFLTQVSTPSLETFDLLFSIASSPRGGWEEDLREVLVHFFVRTPSLRQVRVAMSVAENDTNLAQFAITKKISKRGWIDGQVWTDRLIDRYINELPAVVSLPSISNGSGHSTGEGVGLIGKDGEDMRASGGEDQRMETTDDGEIERLVQMFFKAQDQAHLEAIKTAIFPMLGDSRIPDHIERHLYIFLGSL